MTREPGALMAETRLVVEHREQLWSLLVEAAQYEHMIRCRAAPEHGPRGVGGRAHRLEGRASPASGSTRLTYA